MSTTSRNPTRYPPVTVPAEVKVPDPPPVYLSDEELHQLKAEPDLDKRDKLRRELLAAKRRALAPTPSPSGPAERDELEDRSAKLGITTLESPVEPQSYFIDGFLPKKNIVLVVGDDPSLFLLQLGLCVAAGVPFLGRPTRRGKVLFVECLTPDPDEFKATARSVATYLNQTTVGLNDFSLWIPSMSEELVTSADMRDHIRAERRTLTIINSLAQYEPNYQTNKSSTHRMRKEFNKLLSEVGGSIILSHHYVKRREERVTEDRMVQSLMQDTCGLQPHDIANFLIYLEELRRPRDGDRGDDEDWWEGDVRLNIIRRDRWGKTLPCVVVELEEQELEDRAIGYQEIEPQLASGDKRIFDQLPDPFYRTNVKQFFKGNRSVEMFIDRVRKAGFIEDVTDLPRNPDAHRTIRKGWRKVQPGATSEMCDGTTTS
jgi:hypothetical protein